MEINKKDVRIKLKEILAQKKMSVSQLAKKAKMERKSIYNILNQKSST